MCIWKKKKILSRQFEEVLYLDELLLPKLVRLHNLNDFLLLPPSSISLFSFALLFMHAYGLPKICIDSCLHVFLSFIARCSDSEREWSVQWRHRNAPDTTMFGRYTWFHSTSFDEGDEKGRVEEDAQRDDRCCEVEATCQCSCQHIFPFPFYFFPLFYFSYIIYYLEKFRILGNENENIMN